MKIKQSELVKIIKEVVDELSPTEKKFLKENLLTESFSKAELINFVDGGIKIAKQSEDQNFLDILLQVRRMLANLQ